MLTTEELFREYIKLFTLIVETAGQTEGNKSYKEVTRVLKENEHIVKKIIEEEMSFTPFVASLIFFIIKDIHGTEKLSGENSMETIKPLVDDFYVRYIKKPTRKFTAKYGLPVVEDLNTYIKLYLV